VQITPIAALPEHENLPLPHVINYESRDLGAEHVEEVIWKMENENENERSKEKGNLAQHCAHW